MGEIRERGMARVRGREVRAKLRERPASMHRCRGPCVAARALHRTMNFLHVPICVDDSRCKM